MSYLAENLEHRMKLRGMGPSDVSQMSGVHVATILNVLHGKGRLIPAERHRGCVFQERPSYAGEYDDKNFGDIEIPTEK